MAPQDPITENLVRDRPIALEELIHVPTNARSDFLERFYDAGLRFGPETTAPTLVNAEVERIARTLAVVRIAGSIPRRVGAVDDRELAIDRKRAKRVAHALDQSFRAWRLPRVVPIFDEQIIRREGAQLEWSEFAAEHRTQIQTSLRVVATWAMRHDELRWGRSSVVNLTNELGWVVYALRD